MTDTTCNVPNIEANVSENSVTLALCNIIAYNAVENPSEEYKSTVQISTSCNHISPAHCWDLKCVAEL